jgi:hypothetical protein
MLMDKEPIYADRVYYFLADIAKALEANHREELLSSVGVAMRHFVVPLTSEFMGVAMTALEEVVAKAGDILTPLQIEQAKGYIKSIKNQYFS